MCVERLGQLPLCKAFLRGLRDTGPVAASARDRLVGPGWAQKVLGVAARAPGPLRWGCWEPWGCGGGGFRAGGESITVCGSVRGLVAHGRRAVGPRRFCPSLGGGAGSLPALQPGKGAAEPRGPCVREPCVASGPSGSGACRDAGGRRQPGAPASPVTLEPFRECLAG